MSGRLFIPPHDQTEAEPNDSLAEALDVPVGYMISGAAGEADSGYSLPGYPGVMIADLFGVTVSGNVRITLLIAQDDPSTNNLDLFLLDSAGDLQDASEGTASVELIDVSLPGTYYIGVRAYSGASQYLLSIESATSPAQQAAAFIPAGADFVPGDILVKWRSDAGERSAASSALSDALSRHGLSYVRSLHTGVHKVQVALPSSEQSLEIPGREKTHQPGSRENELKALTVDRILELRMDPEVEYAEPNYLRYALAIPDDPYFGDQWHYTTINLPQAWDVTTGSDDVIVGVLDTGLRQSHLDLAGRYLPGYDFVSDDSNSGDGDGIDPDPEDPGDDDLSFHGTHVSGTVGAATDNDIGVAGVTWATGIMPLRVLGLDGGTSADISQAILFASCLSNASGTVPPQKADIINLSLGGYGSSQTVQEAVTQARAQGVIIVASAGNDDSQNPMYPASYTGVVSVSAVDLSLEKASYSNYGEFVDVAAPGGDMGEDLNDDGYPDGVLSTWVYEGGNTYGFMDGTSMACPHAAGVFALMKAVYPDLTPADVDQLLAGTHPLTTRPITWDLGDAGRDDYFGHGLINASAAVMAAGSLASGAPPMGSSLAISATTLDFTSYISNLSLSVTNTGTGTLNITGVSGGASWLSVSPVTGAAPLQMEVLVDRSSLDPGTHTTTFQIQSDADLGDSTAAVQVRMIVPVSQSTGDVGKVFVVAVDEAGFDTLDAVETVDAVTTDYSAGYAYAMPSLAPGTYYIVAGTDRDEDGTICGVEDACGRYPDPVTILADESMPDVDFMVTNGFTDP